MDNENKKEFVEPEIVVIEFDEDDIIQTSSMETVNFNDFFGF